MKQLRHLARRRVPIAVGLAAAVAVSAVMVATARGDGTAPASPWRIVPFAIVLVALALGLVAVVEAIVGYAPDADAEAERLGHDPDQREVLRRWLTRARWARGVGGSCGIAIWIFGLSTRGDVLLFGVGGLAVGAITAELHHVRRRPGPATASLDVRSLATYLDRRSRQGMYAAATVAAAVALVAAVLTDVSALWWAVASAACLAAVVAVQHRVASRPRPAVPDHLRRADDLVRALAVSRGLARPGTALSLALAAHGLSLVGHANAGAQVASFIVWIAAAVIWWRNRGLSLASVDPSPVPVGS